jgi:(p)ppGpp synthase/HD superfamily hydrolase
MDKTELAKHIAFCAFSGKYDLAGMKYTDHLTRVANNFRDSCTVQAAYLHDLLEDCPEWNIEHLKQLFHQNVANLVELLTKKEGEDYFDYIRRIKTDYDAVRIKMADLEDNMNILRFENKPELSDKDLQRLKKYHRAYFILTHDEKEAPNV